MIKSLVLSAVLLMPATSHAQALDEDVLDDAAVSIAVFYLCSKILTNRRSDYIKAGRAVVWSLVDRGYSKAELLKKGKEYMKIGQTFTDAEILGGCFEAEDAISQLVELSYD